MYYLSACNRGLVKSYYCYVLFLPFDISFKYYEKYFQFHLYIFLRKKFLVDKCKKQMCYKEISLYFSDIMKNGHMFPSKVCQFQIDEFKNDLNNENSSKQSYNVLIF